MKIALVIDDTLDKPDGVQQYVLAIGAWFSSQGHEVHYLAGASTRTDVAHIHSLSRNVAVTFNGNRLTIPLSSNRAAIKRLLEQEQYDVIHVQMPYSPMLAHKIIALAGRRTVVVGTFHIMPNGRISAVGTRLLGLWTAATLRRFDRIFAVSEVAKHFAQQAFRLRDVRISPNVVDIARFQGSSAHRFEDNIPVIMFLGRLVPRKGCASLVAAAALLQERGVDFNLVVCGKGPLLAALQEQAQRLKLNQRIQFTGFVSEDDKPGYMKAADIMVFPSISGESFGIVLVEAMAAGHAVVLAGNNPGYRSVMGERPELLFDPHNVKMLAGKLEELLADVKARAEIVHWQTRHVQQYDVGIVGRQLLDSYTDLHAKRQA